MPAIALHVLIVQHVATQNSWVIFANVLMDTLVITAKHVSYIQLKLGVNQAFLISSLFYFYKAVHQITSAEAIKITCLGIIFFGPVLFHH